MYKHSIYLIQATGGYIMSSKLQKWGNSIGVRIPKSVIEQAKLELNSEVEIEHKDGKIIRERRIIMGIFRPCKPSRTTESSLASCNP